MADEIGTDSFEAALASSPHYRPADIRKFAANRYGRLTSHSSPLGDWHARLTRLEFDSDLFHMEEARLEPLLVPDYRGPLTGDVLEEAAAFTAKILNVAWRQIDHITAPVKASDAFGLIVLQRGGFTMSDTIVVHGLDLSTLAGSPSLASIREATDDDVDELEEIAAACFGSRAYNANRFNCDPAFEPAAVESLYRQWISKSVRGVLADRILVQEVDGELAGFITVSIDLDHATANIPLNAVAPAHQGRGVYTALVKAALTELKEMDVSTVEIRTQLPNLAVHRTWQRLGSVIVDTYHTLSLSLIENKSTQ